MNINVLKEFMIESNRIEGEDRLNPGDMEAVQFAIDNGAYLLRDVLKLHFILGEYLNKKWVGKFREIDVRVGKYKCPPAWDVKGLMVAYISRFKNLDSFEAHNQFQKIHPFQDLNGRVGRLIWLHKALHEGYNFKIPFLQMYYYQTLERYR